MASISVQIRVARVGHPQPNRLMSVLPSRLLPGALLLRRRVRWRGFRAAATKGSRAPALSVAQSVSGAVGQQPLLAPREP